MMSNMHDSENTRFSRPLKQGKKRFLLAFVALAALFSFNGGEAASYITNYWDYLNQYYGQQNLWKWPSYSSSLSRYSESRDTSTYRRSEGIPTQTTSYTTSRTTTSRFSRVSRTQYVNVSVRPIRTGKTITLLDETPVDLFDLNFSYRNNTDKDFVESSRVTSVTFEIFGNTGLAENLDHLKLVANEEEFRFSADGHVTLRFGNARLAQGESINLPIAIKVDNPDYVPHIPGSLRVRLTEATAEAELSGNSIDTRIIGTPLSDFIVFSPNPTVATGYDSTITGRSGSKIYGKMLSAGDSYTVLSTNFEAHYDDLMIKEVTVRDTISSGSIDSFVDSIDAVDLDTGIILGSTRFVNGRARFTFYPRLQVNRGETLRMGFNVSLEDRINSSNLDSRFRLTIDTTDVSAEGIGSGKTLPDSQKYFSLDNETFAVSGGGISVAPSGAPNSLAVGVGPNTAFRFRVYNNGNGAISLGRLSFEVRPSGMEFAGGSISTDDFQLVHIVGGQEHVIAGASNASGNTVQFNLGEFVVDRNSSIEFGLRAAFENLSGNDNSDSVSVRILGDSNYVVDTLSTVQGTGASFIWSDRSARVHSATTKDWMTGYLVPGLPSNAMVIKRY